MAVKQHNMVEEEQEEKILIPDEGWWASVLAEDELLSRPALPKESPLAKGTPTTPPSLTIEDWDAIQSLYENDSIIHMQVMGYNRGGLLVGADGLQGFVPVSHLVDMPTGADEVERREILAAYVGRKISLKVIECDPGQERVVFSERAAQAGEGRRKYLLSTLKPGERIRGCVTNITDFGVFIDLGGLEGLVHLSELSWGRVHHPAELLSVGDSVQALVLNISEENSRVALSIKRLYPNPWEQIAARYQPGTELSAVITGCTRFGAFARLAEGVEGLIHISSISLPEGVEDLNHYLPKGASITVRILHIDAERRRLGLALIQGD